MTRLGETIKFTSKEEMLMAIISAAKFEQIRDVHNNEAGEVEAVLVDTPGGILAYFLNTLEAEFV